MLLLLPRWYKKSDYWCIFELWKSCDWTKMQSLVKSMTIWWICYVIVIIYRDWMWYNRNNWVCNKCFSDNINRTGAISHVERFSLNIRDSSVHPHICTESSKVSLPSHHSKRGWHSSMPHWSEWILQLRTLFYEPALSHTVAHKNKTKLFRRWVLQGHVPPLSFTEQGNNICYVECS